MNAKRNSNSALVLVSSTVFTTLFVVFCSIMASLLAIGFAAIVFTAKLTFGILIAMFAGSRRGYCGGYGRRTWVRGHYRRTVW